MGLLIKQQSLNDLEISALLGIKDDISLYQLNNIFIYRGIRLDEIVFIPYTVVSSSTSTIQDIYLKSNKLHVVINIFKISAFSCLEVLFEKYQYYDNKNYITLVMNIAKRLLSVHMLGLNHNSILLQHNTWSKRQTSLINNVISSMYQILSEDYNIIIKYKSSGLVSKDHPFILGTERLDTIYLDFQVNSDIYIITIKVLVDNNKNNSSIRKHINQKICHLKDACLFSIIITFNTIGQSEQTKHNYIGNFFIEDGNVR